MDLIDVYLGRVPKIGHLLMIIEFLLGSLGSTVSKKKESPLQGRLMASLKKVTNLRKPQQVNLDDKEFEPKAMAELLQALVDLVR